MTTANPHGLLVLAVDDEPTVLRAITSILTTAGFGVVVAEHGVAGLEAFSRQPQAFDLVLADVVMCSSYDLI
jgi:CheY-like chemotaxis protein